MSEIDRTSPIGLYNFGVSYLDTARLTLTALKQPMFNDPIEFLCAHGLELIFKAEICRTFDIEKMPKKYGHNLIKLRRALGEKFLSQFPINAECDNVINYLALGHTGPNWRNRYLITGHRKSLTPSQILRPLICFDTSQRKWLTSHFVRAET